MKETFFITSNCLGEISQTSNLSKSSHKSRGETQWHNLQREARYKLPQKTNTFLQDWKNEMFHEGGNDLGDWYLRFSNCNNMCRKNRFPLISCVKFFSFYNKTLFWNMSWQALWLQQWCSLHGIRLRKDIMSILMPKFSHL